MMSFSPARTVPTPDADLSRSIGFILENVDTEILPHQCREHLRELRAPVGTGNAFTEAVRVVLGKTAVVAMRLGLVP
jgi:hypothetical protein